MKLGGEAMDPPPETDVVSACKPQPREDMQINRYEDMSLARTILKLLVKQYANNMFF